jgi:hypothetical protein
MNMMQRRMLDVFEQRASFYEILLAGKTRKKADGTALKPIKVMSYCYSAQFVNVAAVALATNQGTPLNVDTAGNCDFLMTYMSAIVLNNATQTAVNNPYARWQFNDNSSQTTMFDAPIPVSISTGNGGFPYLLQDPKLIPANTTMIITFYNDMTVGPIAADAFFAFGGYKIFY